MGISSRALTDEEFQQGLMALEQAWEMFRQGRQAEAREHFAMALPIMDACTNKEMDLVKTIADFSEGASRVFEGDAHGGQALLSKSEDAFERMAFLNPKLRKMAIGAKATTLAAMAKASMNAGDSEEAEGWYGKVLDQHRQLLQLLDSQNEDDLGGFFGVYGTRVEIASIFGLSLLSSLDLDELERRLDAVSADCEKFREVLERMPDGPISDVGMGLVHMYAALRDLHDLEEKIVLGRSPVKKDTIEKFDNVAQELFDAEQAANRAGEMGKGLLSMVRQLQKTRRNLLAAGKVGPQDFGKFGGIIAFGAFLVALVVVNLTLKPSGATALLYVLAALILAVITGFGFGALRFLPLLRLYADALKDKGKEEE
jgi:tetratricopeptide (TPR) repeat protein